MFYILTKQVQNRKIQTLPYTQYYNLVNSLKSFIYRYIYIKFLDKIKSTIINTEFLKKNIDNGDLYFVRPCHQSTHCSTLYNIVFGLTWNPDSIFWTDPPLQNKYKVFKPQPVQDMFRHWQVKTPPFIMTGVFVLLSLK